MLTPYQLLSYLLGYKYFPNLYSKLNGLSGSGSTNGDDDDDEDFEDKDDETLMRHLSGEERMFLSQMSNAISTLQHLLPLYLSYANTYFDKVRAVHRLPISSATKDFNKDKNRSHNSLALEDLIRMARAWCRMLSSNESDFVEILDRLRSSMTRYYEWIFSTYHFNNIEDAEKLQSKVDGVMRNLKLFGAYYIEKKHKIIFPGSKIWDEKQIRDALSILKQAKKIPKLRQAWDNAQIGCRKTAIMRIEECQGILESFSSLPIKKRLELYEPSAMTIKTNSMVVDMAELCVSLLVISSKNVEDLDLTYNNHFLERIPHPLTDVFGEELRDEERSEDEDTSSDSSFVEHDEDSTGDEDYKPPTPKRPKKEPDSPLTYELAADAPEYSALVHKEDEKRKDDKRKDDDDDDFE